MDYSKSIRRSKQFPIRKLNGSIHFHYDNVELGPIKLFLEEQQPLIGDNRENASRSPNNKSRDIYPEQSKPYSFIVHIESNSKKWSFTRSYDEFCEFDRQLHRCVFDRRFSKLGELGQAVFDANEDLSDKCTIKSTLSDYLRRFSDLAGSLITCYPVLKWLELDNRGNHLLAVEDSLINIPAIAAAYVVRNYSAQANNEITLYIGDIISVIDMPPPSESFWWRGKLTIGRRESRGGSVDDESTSPVSCDVGFFPSDCVQLFGNRIEMLPLVLRESVYEKPVFYRRKNFVAFFRNFFATRPARRRLKESGILFERVFGCDLAEHLQNTGQDIPLILKCCCKFIETHGIVDGVYRLSGASSNIQRLRCIFDEKKEPNLGEENILRDVHCVSSVLKMYFRELPNPLLTYHLYPLFIEAAKIQDHTIRLLRLHDVVQQLPPPYFRTADYLIKHLSKVASHGTRTGMNFQNLSIVWAPNLLRCVQLENSRADNAGSVLRNVNAQAVVVEYLIRYADMIFSRKLPLFASSNFSHQKDFPVSSSSLPRCSRPQSLLFPTPTKLIDLDVAQRKLIAARRNEKLPPDLTLPDLSDRKCIDVNGGPEALTGKYHTVIDVPSRCARKQKRWKELFGSSILTAKLCSNAGASKASSSNNRKRKFLAENLGPAMNGASNTSFSETSKEGIRHAKSAENVSLLVDTRSTPSAFNNNLVRFRNRRSLRDPSRKINLEFLGGFSGGGQTPCLKPCLQTDLDRGYFYDSRRGGDPAEISATPQSGSKNSHAKEHYCHGRPYSISVHVNLEPFTNVSAAADYTERNLLPETPRLNSISQKKDEKPSSSSYASRNSHSSFIDTRSSFSGCGGGSSQSDSTTSKSKKVAKVSPMNEKDGRTNSISSFRTFHSDENPVITQVNHSARSIESSLDVVSSPEPQITSSTSIPSTLASVCTLSLFDEDGDIVTIQPSSNFNSHANSNDNANCKDSISSVDIDFVCHQFLNSSGHVNVIELLPPPPQPLHSRAISILSSSASSTTVLGDQLQDSKTSSHLQESTISCRQVNDLLSSISSGGAGVSESTGDGSTCGSERTSSRNSANKKCPTFEQVNEALKSLNDLCVANQQQKILEKFADDSAVLGNSAKIVQQRVEEDKETDGDLSLSLYENVFVERVLTTSALLDVLQVDKKREINVKRCNSELLSSETRRARNNDTTSQLQSRLHSSSLTRCLGLKIADAVALYEKALLADSASKRTIGSSGASTATFAAEESNKFPVAAQFFPTKPYSSVPTPVSRDSTLTRRCTILSSDSKAQSSKNIRFRAQSSYESADENELSSSSLFRKQRTTLLPYTVCDSDSPEKNNAERSAICQNQLETCQGHSLEARQEKLACCQQLETKRATLNECHVYQVMKQHQPNKGNGELFSNTVTSGNGSNNNFRLYYV